MQLFSADATMFSKFFFFIFLTTKSWKNLPQKLLIISPEPFFMYWPCGQNSPETKISYHQKPLNAGLGIYTGGISMVDLPNNNNLELYINKWKTTIRLVIFHFLMTDKKKVKNFWTGMVLSVLWFVANNSTAQYTPQNSTQRDFE